VPRFHGVDQPDDWDQAFEDEINCNAILGEPAHRASLEDDRVHRWDFPVSMGDWCRCGQKRWGDG
jgi:hypothetical protein